LARAAAPAPPAAGVSDEVRHTWTSRAAGPAVTRTFREPLPADLAAVRDAMLRWADRCEHDGRALPAPSAAHPIGSATLRADGTVVLDLVAREKNVHGEAQLVYPPTHDDYAGVLAHLEGLCPGESRAVPPWPDPPRVKR
jgi:hypothetical protein